jgi:hypothetical protein
VPNQLENSGRYTFGLTSAGQVYGFIIAAWTLCYIWRPLYLGFYSDDYVMFFVPEKFYDRSEWLSYELSIYSNRILCGLFSYVALAVFGTNPVLWQSFGAMLVLFESVLLFQLLQSLNTFQDNRLNSAVPALIACLSIVNPFSFGFTAWPTYMIASLSMIAFLLAAFAYFRGFIAASLALYAISCLILEAYYFQFVLFLGLSWIYQHGFSVKRTKLVRHLILFSLLQVSIIAYNRLVQGGVRKQLNVDFIITRVFNVIQNPQYWGDALIPFLIVLSFTVLLVRNVWKMRSRTVEPNQAAMLLVICCGVLNLFLYMAVGYSIRPFGIASKTTITISTLFMFMIFFVVQQYPRKAYWVVVTIGVCFVPLFIQQTRAWADSWSLQQEVVRGFPADVVAREGRGATVLAIVPNRADSVLVFEESGALGPALQVHYPELRHARVEFLTHKFGTFSATRTVYDGLQVTQVGRLSGHSQSNSVGEQGLLLWNYHDRSLRRVSRPFVLEEDVSGGRLNSISVEFIE